MRSRRSVLQLGLTAVAGCASGSPRPEPEGPSPALPLPPATPTPRAWTEDVAPFSLRSDLWMNLHHYLFGQAADGDQLVPNAVDLAAWRQLPAPERGSWERAIALYGERWSKNDLLFDDTNHQIKQRLALQGSAESLTLSDQGMDGLAATLNDVAPSYQRSMWPAHRERNLAWAAAARPLVEQHGKALIERLSSLFRATWPAAPVRVDLCINSNWSGAYTSTRPIHIVIASADKRNQGAYALEILFHESSHFMIGSIREALKTVAAKQGVEEPPSLWHALLFYASGRAVAERIPGHEMYADREGIWKGEWAKYRPALAGAWQGYMDGRGTFEDSLATLVRDAVAPP
jgi:hypothetical protein